MRGQVKNSPLTGYRILSLAEQYPGPYATMILADLGADVIMVERPAGGDPTRRYAGHFESLNRNKRSIVLDLKSADGRDAFFRLVDTADALVEGFRPGVMQRLGLGADEMRRRCPALVYMSISSFGQTGPLASVAGHDLSIQGVAGLIDIEPGDESGAVMPTLPLADIASGLFAALGIVTALLARAKSGAGASVDVSMLDSLVSWMTPFIVPAINQLRGAPLPPKDPGYGVFATSDGRQLTLSIAGEDHLWRELCAILGLDDLAACSEEQRAARRDEILPRLRAAIAAHPIDWLRARFEARKIAFGPVRSLTETPEDSQVAARRMIVEVASESGETLRYIRQPLLIDGDGGVITSPAPRLGQHNEEILSALGYDPEDMKRLTEATVIES
jgi:crotonobetainyl-CoA:carnitine CoA-transferase CaiB-like acyl-CoA transferase